MSKKHPRKSLHCIAKLLDCEGFTDYTAQQVLRWAKNQLGQLNAFDRKKRSFQRAIEGLDESQKMAVGKFISIQHEIGFQAGLRMGLMTRLYDEAETCDRANAIEHIGEREP